VSARLYEEAPAERVLPQHDVELLCVLQHILVVALALEVRVEISCALLAVGKPERRTGGAPSSDVSRFFSSSHNRI
jgi:hypothetical protein